MTNQEYLCNPFLFSQSHSIVWNKTKTLCSINSHSSSMIVFDWLWFWVSGLEGLVLLCVLLRHTVLEESWIVLICCWEVCPGTYPWRPWRQGSTGEMWNKWGDILGGNVTTRHTGKGSVGWTGVPLPGMDHTDSHAHGHTLTNTHTHTLSWHMRPSETKGISIYSVARLFTLTAKTSLARLGCLSPL